MVSYEVTNEVFCESNTYEKIYCAQIRVIKPVGTGTSNFYWQLVAEIKSVYPPVRVTRVFSQSNPIFVPQGYPGREGWFHYLPTNTSLTFKDNSGLILAAENQEDMLINAYTIGFSITCGRGECCSEHEMLIESEHYPGWKCQPIEPMAKKIDYMNSEIRRIL